MAEAIASLSLACNIIQVVETGLKAAKFLKETYDKGSTLESRELNDVSAHLSSATATLRASIHSSTRQTTASHAELELLEIAKKCDEITDELIEATNVKTITRKRDRLKASVKAYRNRDKITEIYGRLDRYQQTLQTRLLVNIAAQYNVDGFQTSRNIHDQRTLLETRISKLVTDQTEQINRHTTSTINTAFEDRKVAEEQSRLLKQLKYSLRWPLMFQRQNAISDNHPTTLEWIFTGLESLDYTESRSDESTQHNIKASEQTDNQDTREDHDFLTDDFSDVLKWFREGQGPFWISGSPGSGKSVCMKFLSTDKRIEALLSEWSGQDDVLLLRHFFWLAGDQSQRSYHKMLCSLLYQILNSEGGTIKTSPIIQIVSKHSSKFNIEDWSWKELEEAVVQILSNPMVFACIFIDGLDEMSSIVSGDDDNDGQILRFIRRIGSLQNTKCCISSRPLQEFEVEYRNCTSLRMQSLNTKDIQKYTVDRLNLLQNEYGPPIGEVDTKWAYLEWRYRDRNLTNVQTISVAITTFANGIFLWAAVVIRDLHNGFRDADDVNDLLNRVERYPRALHELYIDIWRRHNDDSPSHRAEAALYFRLAITAGNLEAPLSDIRSLLSFSIASSNMPPLESFRNQKAECIRDLCTQTTRKLRTRCAGLLEVRRQKTDYALQLVEEFDVLNEFQALEVSFIHRSVIDFLNDSHSVILGTESGFGKQSAEDELACLLLHAYIRMTTISSQKLTLSSIDDIVIYFGKSSLRSQIREQSFQGDDNRLNRINDIIEEFWIWTSRAQQISYCSPNTMADQSKRHRCLLNSVPFPTTSEHSAMDFYAWMLWFVGPTKLPFYGNEERKAINPVYIQYLLFNSVSTWNLYLTGPEENARETLLQYFLKFGFVQSWCGGKLPLDNEACKTLHRLIPDLLKAVQLKTTKSLLRLFLTLHGKFTFFQEEFQFRRAGEHWYKISLSVMVNDCFLLRLLSKTIEESDTSLFRFFDSFEPDVKPCAHLVAVSQLPATAVRMNHATVSPPPGFDQVCFQNLLLSYLLQNESEELVKEVQQWMDTLYEQGTKVDILEHLRREGIASDSDHPDILWEAPPMYLNPEEVDSHEEITSSAADAPHISSLSAITDHPDRDSDVSSDEFVDAVSDLDVK